MPIRCARGTKDVLPADIPTWHFLEDLARDLAEDYGYREIRTPMFECAEIFLKGMGATSGLVERELWTFHDKHGRKLALRADMTAPTMRACQDHDLIQPELGPTRLYYLGSVFMHGREREVESRQLHQFGMEALGTRAPALDAEVLVMVSDLCLALGLPQVQVQLNTLGCKKCRPAYHQVLKDYFGGRQDELCKTCRRRYRTHPTWTLACQAEPCLELSRVVPSIYGNLCPDCRDHFSALKAYLKELKVDYQLNPLVVRDLEYYDRTIFQVTCAGRTVAFGGRYDELSTVLGGPSTPAVGCSVDLEPLLEAMREAGLEVPGPEPPRVSLAGNGQEAVTLLLPIVYALRRAGIGADLVYPSNPEETAVQAADRATSPWLVLLEEEDVRRRVVTLVEVEKQRRQQVRLEEAVSRIGRELGLEGLKDELRPVEVRRVSIGRRRRSVRSRAIYGVDIPRLSRTSSRAEATEDTERSRRRRRRSAKSEEVETTRPVSAEEPTRRHRKRRRSRRASEASPAEVEAATAESPEEEKSPEGTRPESSEMPRRSRRHRHESEDSLEAAAASETPVEEPTAEAPEASPRRPGRGRRRRRSTSPAAEPVEPSAAESDSGEGSGTVSEEGSKGTRRRRVSRRRSRRGGTRGSGTAEEASGGSEPEAGSSAEGPAPSSEAERPPVEAGAAPEVKPARTRRRRSPKTKAQDGESTPSGEDS
jgi:histidyl-tRNA synthetase